MLGIRFLFARAVPNIHYITFFSNQHPRTSPDKPGEVIDADAHYHAQQSHKQLIHRGVINAFIYLPADRAAEDAAEYHKREQRHRELRHTARDNGEDEACQLREQDNIQGILRGGLGVHREEEIEHHEIERPAAYAEERGHHAQRQTDKRTQRF